MFLRTSFGKKGSAHAGPVRYVERIEAGFPVVGGTNADGEGSRNYAVWKDPGFRDDPRRRASIGPAASRLIPKSGTIPDGKLRRRPGVTGAYGQFFGSVGVSKTTFEDSDAVFSVGVGVVF